MSKAKRKSAEKYRSKPGEHGTLYLYNIRYDDANVTNSGRPPMWSQLWGYNEEHVRDRFFDGDDSWQILGIERVKEPSGPSVGPASVKKDIKLCHGRLVK
jgi:hypothetical protein